MPTPNDKPTPPKESRPLSEAEQQADYVPTPSAEEMRDAFLLQLYNERTQLKGIALVNGLKAVNDLAKQAKLEPEPDPLDDPTRSLLDKIDALPAPHAAKLLDKEIERLETELADHVAKREQLKGHL